MNHRKIASNKRKTRICFWGMVGSVLVLGLPIQADLAHYWSLDGVSDTGADIGGTTLNTSLGTQTNAADRFGRANRAMGFVNDAGGLTYDVPDGQRIDDFVSYSVAAWVLHENPAGASFDRIAEGAFGTDFYLGTDASGSTNYSAISSSGVNPRAIGGTISGEWQLVGMTYSGTAVDLYVNGVFVDGGVGSDPEEFTQLGIGAAPNGASDWDGLLDEVSIWNTALSNTNMAAMYNVSVNGTLQYDIDHVDALFDLYNAGSGSAAIKGSTWQHASGLSGSAGELVDVGGGQFNLVMDGAGNGLTTVIPEPSTLALFAIAGCALAACRRWMPKTP